MANKTLKQLAMIAVSVLTSATRDGNGTSGNEVTLGGATTTEPTDSGGSGGATVAFNVSSFAGPTPNLFRSIPTNETIFMFWNRNTNSRRYGFAELSAKTNIYWS